MSLILHDDIISVYLSVSVDQQMSLALYDDIILVYIYIWIGISTNVYNVVIGTSVDRPIQIYIYIN
jgi:hypothetical protein